MASFFMGVHIVCMNSSKRSLNFESCFIGADPLPPQPPVLVIILNPPDPGQKTSPRQSRTYISWISWPSGYSASGGSQTSIRKIDARIV